MWFLYVLLVPTTALSVNEMQSSFVPPNHNCCWKEMMEWAGSLSISNNGYNFTNGSLYTMSTFNYVYTQV